MNPYLILGVPLDADDQAIRRAYLDGIKQSPPDLDPAQFQVLNAAYEQIKNEACRHQHILFDHTVSGDSPLDVFVRYAQIRREARALPFETMKKLLQACGKS